MPKSRRSAVSDFTKVKRKVGKTAPNASSFTRTDFAVKSVRVPVQRPFEAADDTAGIDRALHLFTHHNAATRKDAVSALRSAVLRLSNALLEALFTRIIERAMILMCDEERCVRAAVTALLETLLASVSAATVMPLLSHIVNAALSALTHRTSPVRRCAVGYTAILVARFPRRICSYRNAILPPLTALLADRMQMTAQTPTDEHTSARSVKSAQNKPAVLKLKLQFRLLIMQTMTALLVSHNDVDAQTDSVRTHVDTINALVSGQQHVTSSSVSQFESSPVIPPIQIAAPRKVPLKYRRRTSAKAATPKAVITSIDTDMSMNAFINKLADTRSSQQTSAALPPSRFTMASFIHQTVPLIIEHWIELQPHSDGGMEQTSMTSEHYACMNGCLLLLRSLFHQLTNNQTDGDADAFSALELLNPFRPSFIQHVFSLFPIANDSIQLASHDMSALTSINLHIAHLTTYFLSSASTSDNTSLTQRKCLEVITSDDDMTEELLVYIGYALQSTTTSADDTVKLPSRKRPLTYAAVAVQDVSANERKRLKKNLAAIEPPPAVTLAVISSDQQKRSSQKRLRNSAKCVCASAAAVGSLLPIITQLMPRVSSEHQTWLLQVFTRYYIALPPTSPAKLDCIHFIATILAPPLGQRWVQSDVGWMWLRSLPTLLCTLIMHTHANKQTKHNDQHDRIIDHPAIGRIIRVLTESAQYYPRSICDMTVLQSSLLPFFHAQADSNTRPHENAQVLSPFYFLPSHLQLLSLHFVTYFRVISPQMLSALTTCARNQQIVPTIRQAVVEAIYINRVAVGLSGFLSFMLSILAQQHQALSSTVSLSQSALQMFVRADLTECVRTYLRTISNDSAFVYTHTRQQCAEEQHEEMMQCLPPQTIIFHILKPTLTTIMMRAITITQYIIDDFLNANTTATPCAELVTDNFDLSLSTAVLVADAVFIRGSHLSDHDFEQMMTHSLWTLWLHAFIVESTATTAFALTAAQTRALREDYERTQRMCIDVIRNHSSQLMAKFIQRLTTTLTTASPLFASVSSSSRTLPTYQALCKSFTSLAALTLLRASSLRSQLLTERAAVQQLLAHIAETDVASSAQQTELRTEAAYVYGSQQQHTAQ